jgi:hypothetical protein
MEIGRHDWSVLRPLAERYSVIAHLKIQHKRIERYYSTIRMEPVRPAVLIDEVPWGEIRDMALQNRCQDGSLHEIESMMRRALYQWEHFQVDTVTYIISHEYIDQLKGAEELAKLKLPGISYDKAATKAEASIAEALFDGLLPVEIVGTTFNYNIWDEIAKFRGVDNLFMDLAVNPALMH